MNTSGISPSQSSNSGVGPQSSNKRKLSAMDAKVVELKPAKAFIVSTSTNSTSRTNLPALHSMSAQDIVNRLLHDASLNRLSRRNYYQELKARSNANTCNNLTLTFKYETSLNHVPAIFNCCPNLKTLSIHFDYWEDEDPTNDDEDIYFSSLRTILTALHHPSSLTSLEFRGYRPYNNGLGLSGLELINNFLEIHKLKLNHLHFDIHKILWQEDITELLKVLDRLRAFTQNMSISVALYELSTEELPQLRKLKLQGVIDSTYDEDLNRGSNIFVTENGIIESYFEKYISHYEELATWESLESLDLSHLDFIDQDVFTQKLDSDHLEQMRKQMCKKSPPQELFGKDDPALPAYVDRQELFNAIANLPVKSLVLRYPHCKVHSLLKDYLENGLKNLVELKIVGYCEAMGSAAELHQLIISSRKGLKCTIECGNSWANE